MKSRIGRVENLLWIIIVVTIKGLSSANDLPCNKVLTQFGFVCVCNSTYCDTVERPSRLTPGLYHQYTTSSTSPGFTHTQGQFSSFSGNAEYVFTVHNSVKRQEFFGVGGSFTNSVGVNFRYLSVDTQERFMQSYFSTHGIEYSMGRVPIASSDFSPRRYTFDEVPFDFDLEHFALPSEENEYKIPLIQKALSMSERGLKLIGSTWTSPSWMKMNNSTDGGYLGQKYSSVWANYHIKFLNAYKKERVEFWALSCTNELLLDYIWNFLRTMLPMISTAMQQRDWFKNHLKPQLIAANYSDVKLIVLEDQRLFAFYVMDRFAEDPEAYDAIDAIGLHWYFNRLIPPIVLDLLHQKYPEKYILSTETSINSGKFSVQLGGWPRGEAYAFDIIECLNHWSQSYIDWNLALNTEGGPSLSFDIDSPVIINTTSGEFYKQPMFYVLGHFSKFILPGSNVVQVSNKQSAFNKLKQDNEFTHDTIRQLIANKRKKGDLDDGEDIKLVPMTVTCAATSNSDGSYSIFLLNSKNTSATVRVEVPEVGNIAVSMEQQSLVTFVYWT